MPYNFAADSFHRRKLCSRLSSSEMIAVGGGRLNVIMKSSSTTQYHTQELKNISPSTTTPLPTSKTVCDLHFIVHFIFYIANVLIVYFISSVFIVSYAYCSFVYIVYLSNFTNLASWLPH